MLPRIQLVGSPFTRAFRNVWMLEELGIPYEILDLKPGSRNVKSYVESGKIPVLLEFDNEINIDSPPSFTLYESSAINTYLADTYGSNKYLVPIPGTRERAIYDQTVSCIMTELDSQGLWIHRKHEAMGKIFGYVPDAVKEGKHNFTRINQQLSKQLNPYLLGKQFTAADILYIHCLDWSKSIGWHNDWPLTIQPYRELCHQRLAYQEAKIKRDVNKDERKQEISSNMLESEAEKSKL